MAHGMVREYDQMASGRKKSVWHQSDTDTVLVDGLMDVDEAYRIGFRGGWEPTIIPARIGTGPGESMIVPDTFFVVRDDLATDDLHRVLGTVGKRYNLIGNREIIEFCDAFANKGNARIDTVGTINFGRRVYVSACLASEEDIEGDKISQWLLITSTHDGTGAWEGMIVPLRVVCQNTLTCALGNATNRIKIRHTKSAQDRMAQVSRIWDGAHTYFAAHADAMRSLANKRITRKEAEAFLTETVITGGATTSKAVGAISKADKARRTVLDLFDGGQLGAGTRAVDGTVYGLVNAWSQWAETDKTIHKHTERSDDEARMESVLFGQTARARDTIMAAALAL